MHTHIDPFAQATISQYLKHSRLPSQLVFVGKVCAKRAIEQYVALVSGAPFYADNPDVAKFRLSFATANAGKIEAGVGLLGKAL